MEQIRLTSYGFTRCKEMDFSDDGNHFKAYTYKGARITYLKSYGRIYIAARVQDIGLTYEEYSKAPHYQAMDALNGIEENELTPQKIEELKEDIVSYILELEEIKANVKEVLDEEIINYYKEVHQVKENQLEVLLNKLNEIPTLNLLDSLSEYDIKTLKSNIKQFINEVNRWAPENAIKTSQENRRNALSKKYELHADPSYWYRSSMDILEKVAY